MSSLFDITNPETYRYVSPDEVAIYKGVTICDEKTQPMKAIEFVNFINALEKFLNKNNTDENKIKLKQKNVEGILERLLKTNNLKEIKEKEFLIQSQVNNIEQTLKNKLFNPFDENTWKYAQENAVLFINKKPIYEYDCNNKKYLFEPYLQQHTEESWHYSHKFFHSIHDQKYIDFICYSLLSDSTEYDNEIITTINNFPFTKAVYDVSQFGGKPIEFIAEKLSECEEKQLSQNEMQKELRYADILHGYTLSRLMGEKQDYKKVVYILEDFYTSREMRANAKQFHSALNKSSFLKSHPDAKFSILETYKEKRGE